jgi:hypothetical protein
VKESVCVSLLWKKEGTKREVFEGWGWDSWLYGCWAEKGSFGPCGSSALPGIWVKGGPGLSKHCPIILV